MMQEYQISGWAIKGFGGAVALLKILAKEGVKVPPGQLEELERYINAADDSLEMLRQNASK